MKDGGQSVWKSRLHSAADSHKSKNSLKTLYIVKLSNVANYDTMFAAESEVKILNHLGRTDFSSVLYRVIDTIDFQAVLYHAIIFEDSGISLDKLPLKKSRMLQSKAVASLQKLHRRGVVHGDIRLPNFVYNLVGDEVRIIDFGESYIMDINSSEFHRQCNEEVNNLLKLFSKL